MSLSDGQADFVQDERPLLTRNQLPNAMGEIDGPAALVDGDQVKMWFGGHAPVAALGPLIARGFRGDEFGIDFAMRPVADFRRDVAALTAR
ncbi:MAG: hypothetical protein JOZ27_08590 [Caulobacteraceae bacterium]|nr:hypothetical protein [Caulobacteraceae bacterium]